MGVLLGHSISLQTDQLLKKIKSLYDFQLHASPGTDSLDSSDLKTQPFHNGLRDHHPGEGVFVMRWRSQKSCFSLQESVGVELKRELS